MTLLGPLGFAAPWILTALALLPALWWLLRAVPPRPREVVFPGAALLAGLSDPAPLARRTPWWLLAIRLAALAAVILALAGPVWRPGPRPSGDGPLLIVMDAGWAAAPGWEDARARGLAALSEAAGAGRPVALILADGESGMGQGREGQGGTAAPVRFGLAADAAARLRAAVPQPWATRLPSDPAALLAEAPARFDTLWLSDGLDHPGRGQLLATLAARGRVTVAPPAQAARSLALSADRPPALVLRQAEGGGQGAALPAVVAIGPDPQGTLRELGRLTPPLPVRSGGVATATFPIDLPPELRNRVIRFALADTPSAGAVALADDRVRRRKVALVGDGRATEGQALLAPLHYLRRALAPTADLVEGAAADVLAAAPDVVVLADAPPAAATAELDRFVQDGGLLIRFAGPRLAASADLDRDALLPVRLRPGGRDAGGALAWGEPRGVAPFPAEGPFAGLAIPGDVTVRAQLLPEPDPDLPRRTLAQLTDGTPLVTRAPLGQGQIVLVHTSANADWSNLALSGLFVQMLDRLVQAARSGDAGPGAADALSPDSLWRAEVVLDGFGRPVSEGGPGRAPVTGAVLAQGPGPDAPAGIYAAGERRQALNAGGPITPATWPGATVLASDAPAGRRLDGALLLAAALLAALDALGSGRVAGTRPGRVRPGAGRQGAEA